MKLALSQPRVYLPLVVAGAALLTLGSVAVYKRAAKRRALLPPPAGTRPSLVTILFENKDASDVFGTGNAPTFDALAAQYQRLTNYTMGLHPSLPNYLLLTSGSTQGVTDDAGPDVHPIAGTENLFSQLEAAGIPWRAYAESMTTPCQTESVTPYMARHNPAVYYDAIRSDPAVCGLRVVDLTPLEGDLARNAAAYSWVTPNEWNDMHTVAPGSPTTNAVATTVRQGDAWLRTWLPILQAAPGYRAGGVIMVLFDESRREGHPRALPALLISEKLRGAGPDSALYTHLNYLATVQDLLGLPRLPGTQGVASWAARLG